jgi:hypothetical protein
LDHDPVEDESDWPCCAVPLTVGAAVFTGATTTSDGGATTAEAALVAVADPAAFVAVTTARSVCPTSVLTSARLDPVAPAIVLQDPPPLSQRRHW